MGTKEVLISVIINVYNGEKYIKKCIDSIINQTYKNLEIIIVNDGSTDNTLSICKKIKDKRIRIITQKNKGLSLSRNVGIDNSKGEYLFFVDADDFIEKDTIEYLYNLCINNNVLMSTCDIFEITNYNYNNKNKKEKVEILSGKDLLCKILVSEGRNGTIWNKMLRRDLFDDLRFENRIINDVVVVYKIALKLDKYVYSNQNKYYYFIHSDSILGMHKPAHSIDYYKATIERYNYIKNIYPDLYENDICVLWSIVTIYSHNDKEVNEFLEENNANELFKKLFSLKIITSKLKFNDKVKIILYRISPKLYRKTINFYLKIRDKK